MGTKNVKHEYLVAFEIPFKKIGETGSFRPLKLLFGKRVFKPTSKLKFYGSFIDYIRFCRLNALEITLSGEEF